MRRRTAIVAAALLALVIAGPVGAASGDGTIKMSSVPSKFPERTFAVTLPKKVALKPGLIRVFENGALIEKVAITPLGGARGGDFGAVLLIDASESMKGEAIAGATAAARAFAERRKPGQKLSIASYNDATEILLPFTSEQRRIDEALSMPPELAYWTRMYDAIERVVSVIQTEKLPYSSQRGRPDFHGCADVAFLRLEHVEVTCRPHGRRVLRGELAKRAGRDLP
jgi:hypothetical protein